MNRVYNKPNIDIVRYDAPDDIMALSAVPNTAQPLTDAIANDSSLSISFDSIDF